MVRSVAIDLNQTLADLQDTINDNRNKPDNTANPFVPFTGFNLFNYDIKSLAPNADSVNVYVLLTDGVVINSTGIVPDGVDSIWIHQDGDAQGYIPISDEANNALFNLTGSDAQAQNIGLLFQFSGDDAALDVDLSKRYPIVADFISFGFKNDGRIDDERIANQIIRIEAKETGENTSTFAGTLEYTMINQLNINDINTYQGISTIADDPTFIVMKDLRDEDNVRVTYLDVGGDGVEIQISDQEEASSHDGVISFDSDSYKTADTVVITVNDFDLDVNSDLKDIYTVVTVTDDPNRDVVGSATINNNGTSITLSNGEQLGRLLEVTFDDQRWTENNDCGIPANVDAGLGATGFTLAETTKDSGLFVGSFQIPAEWCREDANTSESATGLDIKVKYVDYRDASGEIIEIEDSAHVSIITSSINLDRTVYPVPFGVPSNFRESTLDTPAGKTSERSLFPIHQTGMNSPAGLNTGEFLNAGDLSIHLKVYDPDFDVSASGIDTISENVAGTNHGPVKISVLRGDSDIVVLGYAGGPSVMVGTIDVGDDGKNHHGTQPVPAVTRSFGPLSEISQSAGIFEADITIRYTDGPASILCPDTKHYEQIDGNPGSSQIENRFDAPITTAGENYCILQGDILQVEYTNTADATGDIDTVTDLATFDLRDGVLQSDKSVYVVGSDMILTLIEPDLDLDSDQAEIYDLDLIEWGYDAVILTMGDASGNATKAFDPKPINLTETGNGTGVFQLVVKVPKVLDSYFLERGKEIVLEYTDWGPSGSEYVGDEDKDVSLTVFTSNFGATVALDKKVYSWTDKVYITIVAPDYNFDSDLVDEIGDSNRDPIRVATRGFNIDGYKLVETGTDTGIFTGEVILTGFEHDADGDGTIDDTNPRN